MGMKKILFALIFLPIVCFAKDNINILNISNSGEIEKRINSLDIKHDILGKQDLIELINDLKNKSCLLNERARDINNNNGEYLACEEIDLIKDSPYSISSTFKLLNFSSQAFSVCMIGNDSDIFNDVKFIHSKVISHVKYLSQIHDLFIAELLEKQKLAKK